MQLRCMWGFHIFTGAEEARRCCLMEELCIRMGNCNQQSSVCLLNAMMSFTRQMIELTVKPTQLSRVTTR
nr:hypothetical protein Iba_chr03fCG2940 [Ipomoea batatas]GMC77910.1 hypothetical protein Iba_chr03fCG2970 [Ipomoea batatas]